MKPASLLSCVVLAGIMMPLAAQDFSDYVPVSLSEAWTKAVLPAAPGRATAGKAAPKTPAAKAPAPKAPALNSGSDKFVVKAVYTGNARNVGLTRLSMIRKWAIATGQKEMGTIFNQEIEVKADGKTVWLPIQEELANSFPHEVADDEVVTLWIQYIGEIQGDRIFLVNEFMSKWASENSGR